jgi:hypothetical protein
VTAALARTPAGATLGPGRALLAIAINLTLRTEPLL